MTNAIRSLLFTVLLALLVYTSTIVYAALSVAGVSSWAGNERVFDMGVQTQSPDVIISWGADDTSATIYCGNVDDINNQYDWWPVFGGAAPPNTLFQTYSACRYIMVATFGQPVVNDVGVVPESAPPPRR